MAATKRKGAAEPAVTSYTPDPRQQTMEGLPSQAPQVVPDDVRYQEIVERYGRKPKRAPAGQLVLGGIGLAGPSLDALKLSDPHAQMGLFGGPATTGASRPEASKPTEAPPSSRKVPPSTKGRRGG